MGKIPQYVDCILPIPVNQYFTYSIPVGIEEKIHVGCRVIVQFGSRKFHTAIVCRIHQEKPEYETKPIESVLDETPLISEKGFRFWQWIADYYCCSQGEVMKAALPSGLKLESQTSVYMNNDWAEKDRLTDTEEIVFQFISSQKTTTIQQINSFTKKSNAYSIIQSLLRKEAINIEEKITERYQPKTVAHIKISPSLVSEEDFETVFQKLKKTKKQLDLFMFLLNELHHFSTTKLESIPKKELLLHGNFTENALRGLIEKGYVEVVEVEVDRISENAGITRKPFSLNQHQEEALNLIHQQFIDKKVVLLHGITASGKTEIYIKLIAEQFRAGKQVLYLLPEIALTSQIIDRLKAVFGNKAGIYHSKFNDAERIEIWNKVEAFEHDKSTGYQLILGARSAIFLPFENLGLIIVDEEHETSYKQFDPAPRYNARDAAIVLAQIHGAKVLLGTATPSFESYFNAQSGKYGYVQLTKRYFDVAQPEITVADIADAQKRKQMKSLFTPLLFNEMQKALENKEQIILFQNRRGYSPYIQCHSCGWIPVCKHCDVSLTYHKNQNNLQCHYCGYTIPLPQSCGNCHSTDVRTKGFGTEKIEDELHLLFPNAVVDRLDLDSTRKKFGHEKILNKFSDGKTQILVGTQMITKGLDFENVSVVGILDADSLLNYPDFRSHERAFQLMSQVSGRAGRKNKQGKVIIQTYQPNHSVIDKVISNNFEGLFSQTIQERKFFKYPPWYRLIYITIKHKNRERAQLASQQLAKELQKTIKTPILGPEYPLLSRVQQYYQLMIRIKLERTVSPAEPKKSILEAIEKVKHYENNGTVLFSIDVDPI
jgi:primosomal protein N' (replication factor Y) (superfamily II helicase)